MKKKLSKGMMQPMLLDYLFTFGTSWQDYYDVLDFRIRYANDDLQKHLLEVMGHELYSKRSVFRQALAFGYIEARDHLLNKCPPSSLTVTQYRLSQKGMRRIARG